MRAQAAAATRLLLLPTPPPRRELHCPRRPQAQNPAKDKNPVQKSRVNAACKVES